MKYHLAQFSEKDDPFHLKFWVNRPPMEQIRRFKPIIARSASAVTPSEKSSINANRKSNEPNMIVVRCP